MMFTIFAALALALLFSWIGKRRLALIFMGLCLVLAVKEFLWEIHSDEYGYRMPWIQTHLVVPTVNDGSQTALLSSQGFHGELA